MITENDSKNVADGLLNRPFFPIRLGTSSTINLPVPNPNMFV